MIIDRHPILRTILSIFFLGWGIVQCLMFFLNLSSVSFVTIVYLITGLILLPIGLFGLLHRVIRIAKLMCVLLFFFATLLFIITLIIHLFSIEVAISWGSLFTAFLAALELSLLV